jgi:hypothetical protein
MLTPLDEHLNNLRCEDLRRIAARERLAGDVRRGRPVFSLRVYRPALHQVGCWLVLSGTYLKRRYGDMRETTPARHNHPAHSGNF